jgi:hypothetical protein
MQYEGEVEICTDDFHLQKTNQNNDNYIAGVLAKRDTQRQKVTT